MTLCMRDSAGYSSMRMPSLHSEPSASAKPCRKRILPLSMAIVLNVTADASGSYTGVVSRHSRFTLAASSASRSACAMSAIGSATWRIVVSTSAGWSSSISATTFLPGMSACWTMVKPDRVKSERTSTSVPAGIVDRMVRPWRRPGNVRSSMYRAVPVTFSKPSLRRTLRPTARSAAPDGGCGAPVLRRNQEMVKGADTSTS